MGGMSLSEAEEKANVLWIQLEALITHGKRVAAIDLVYDTVDDLFLAGSFDAVGVILRVSAQHVSQPELPLSLFLSMMTIAIHARGEDPMLDQAFLELAAQIRARGSSTGEDLVEDYLCRLERRAPVVSVAQDGTPDVLQRPTRTPSAGA
jgi:hypothetical protein